LENAFNILTLDRFTLWASIMSLPMAGEFAYRMAEGDFKETIQNDSAMCITILGIYCRTFLFFAVL
jgi:hypothetical protein